MLTGACHCRAVRVAFEAGFDPAATAPRACDCSFCRKHGAGWVSDATGRLAIGAESGALRAYRQGSNTADFLLCARCGVLVAVVYDHARGRHGAVNYACLDVADSFAPVQWSAPQRLAPADKVARWLQLWVPDVRIDTR
jgi:hypothetical protein